MRDAVFRGVIPDRKPDLVVPCLGPSLNEFYAGKHYRARQREAKKWHDDIALLARGQRVQKTTGQVVLIVEAVFGPGRTRYDATNLAAMAKLVEDGLVGEGVLQGDSPKFVKAAYLQPSKGTSDEIRIWLEPVES